MTPAATTRAPAPRPTLTQSLYKHLKSEGLYETAGQRSAREEANKQLREALQEWIKGAARASMRFSEEQIDEARVEVYLFGSYAHDTHFPGGDIDILVLGPWWADRDKVFFGSGQHCLEQVLKASEGEASVMAIPDAFVPLLKYHGFDLDIAYANLKTTVPGQERTSRMGVPAGLDLSPPSVLAGMDEVSIRSVNGVRVTDAIMGALPRWQGPLRVEHPLRATYRLVIKALKLWAKRRNIYGSVFGYLGGVNIAILVASVIKTAWEKSWDENRKEGEEKKNKMLSAVDILLKVSLAFGSHHTWPHAVHLVEQDFTTNMGLDKIWWYWNQNTHDLDLAAGFIPAARMAIVTPVYPATNSMHKGTRCSANSIISEFIKAEKVIRSILLDSVEHPDRPPNWDLLFAPHSFFEHEQGTYLEVEACACTDTDLDALAGMTQAKWHPLACTLENRYDLVSYCQAVPVPAQTPVDFLPQGVQEQRGHPRDPAAGPVLRKRWYMHLSEHTGNAYTKPKPKTDKDEKGDDKDKPKEDKDKDEHNGNTPKEDFSAVTSIFNDWANTHVYSKLAGRVHGMGLHARLLTRDQLPSWVAPERGDLQGAVQDTGNAGPSALNRVAAGTGEQRTARPAATTRPAARPGKGAARPAAVAQQPVVGVKRPQPTGPVQDLPSGGVARAAGRGAGALPSTGSRRGDGTVGAGGGGRGGDIGAGRPAPLGQGGAASGNAGHRAPALAAPKAASGGTVTRPAQDASTAPVLKRPKLS